MTLTFLSVLRRPMREEKLDRRGGDRGAGEGRNSGGAGGGFI